MDAPDHLKIHHSPTSTTVFRKPKVTYDEPNALQAYRP